MDGQAMWRQSEPVSDGGVGVNQLQEAVAELVAAAAQAQKMAYAPYSRFPVGAALLASDGTIYAGCNIENASYGLTICAERNAIAHAICAGQSSSSPSRW